MKCLHETVYLRVVTDSWQTGDTSGVSPSSLKLIGTRNRLIKVRRLIAFFFGGTELKLALGVWMVMISTEI